VAQVRDRPELANASKGQVRPKPLSVWEEAAFAKSRLDDLHIFSAVEFALDSAIILA
jgi:hypothetical protein